VTLPRAASIAAAVLLACAAPASAETFGVRGGFYAEAGEPFVGGELLLRLTEKVQLVPNVEVLLVDDGRHLVGSVDLHYDISCTCSAQTVVYAGAGAAVVSRRPPGGDDATTDLGLNVVGGFGLRLGRLTPYAQLRGTIKKSPELAIGVGLRF
jgi:hypothetical protein